MRLKDEKRKSEEEGGLVFTGQLEVNSTLQSKHSTIHSKHSTLPSKHSTLKSNTRLHNKNTDQVNMNIIILQSASSARLLKFIQDAKLLIKLNDDKEHNECDLEVTYHPEHNHETHKSETEEIPKSQTTMKDDSPILLRKNLKSMAPKPPLKSIVKSNSSHYKSAFSEVQPAYSSNKYKSRNSDLFYSLQSNLDLSGQSHAGHDKQALPLDIQDIHQNKNSSPHSQVLSSLPSMTSGRFYSANSSLFSSMSSPRSVGTVELSPNREDSSDSTDTVKKKETNAHIEPIVEIVNPHNNAVSVHDLCKANSLERNTKFTLDHVRNTHSLDRERKVTVASFDNNRGKSFLKKSLSISSPYENMTRVVGSLEQLEIEHKPLSRNNSVKSVKFSSSGSSTVDLSNRKSKFYSFHTHSLARKKISGLKKPPKLGVKQIGTIIQELDSGHKVIQTVNEEGELAGWSSKDIYDIVSKDLPSMDIVVLVVNQDEKKVLDKTLNRSTGVVGYIKEYWSGFFPLLLIELANKNGETEPIESKSLKALNSMFSVIHRIIIDDFESSTDFIFESVARFYSHIKIFQCEKFQQSLHTEKLGQLISLSLTEKFWICSGLCKMRTSQKTKEGRKRGVSLMQTMRNTAILKRVLSGEGVEEENKDENIS